MNEPTTDSVLLAAIEQFEDQTASRVLIAALEEYEDLGTTHCMCTISIFVVNARNVKVENKKN